MSIECFWSFPSVWGSQTDSKIVYDPLQNNFTITLHPHWKLSNTNLTFWMGMAHPIWCNVTHWEVQREIHCKPAQQDLQSISLVTQQTLAQPAPPFSLTLHYRNVTNTFQLTEPYYFAGLFASCGWRHNLSLSSSGSSGCANPEGWVRTGRRG